MFAIFSTLRKLLRPIGFVAAAGALLSACQPVSLNNGSGDFGSGKPVKVALLLPQSDAEVAAIAQSLENAARLALVQQPDLRVELRVYDTAGQAATAAEQARVAVADGAQIILGPLRADAVNAAGLAVAQSGVNVLGFSNNASIAGGNVFILGQTFSSVADRLTEYARMKGRNSAVILHSRDIAGESGRVAFESAAALHGLRIVASEGYELSISGVSEAAQRAAASLTAAQADTIFITPPAQNAAMPMLLSQLPSNGVDPAFVQFGALSRLDARPDLFSLPGAEGIWFAVPDMARQNAFNASYNASYGSPAHPLAGLAYDGISAIGALGKTGQGGILTREALTSASFMGARGVFRLLSDGSNQRALAVASVQDKQMVILDPAPNSLDGSGF